ncbi:MAG: amidohydrolase family protein [Acidimicrobiales bacterium]
MEPLLVFSGDGHAGAPVEAYQPYIEPQYRPLLDELVAENELYMAVAGRPSQPTDEALAVFDDRGAVRAGGALGAWDIDVRLKMLDADGVAGELVHPGHQNATLPFFGIVNKPVGPDVRAAGQRAYHRWLADFMAGGDGRLVGVAEPGPCADMDMTLRELEWVADHGFVSVSLPGTTADPDLPPLSSSYFEPFFARCEDLGLVMSVHAGFGLRQGVFFDFHSKLQEMMAGSGAAQRDPDQAQAILAEAMSSSGESPLRLDIGARRPLWLLMASGVFDRHPNLKLALTEVRADWVPATIAHLDARLAARSVNMKMKPSEYYQRHVAVAASSIHPAEVEMRDAIGLHQLMFGSDYPHPEGTWPNTKDWIRDAFAGVPEDQARMILGGNAIAFYGLDRDKFAQVAARVGHPAGILDDRGVAEPLIDHFDQRAGYRRPAEVVDTDVMDTVIEADLAALV